MLAKLNSHTADLVTFTEEIFREKLHLLCSALICFRNNVYLKALDYSNNLNMKELCQA